MVVVNAAEEERRGRCCQKEGCVRDRGKQRENGKEAIQNRTEYKFTQLLCCNDWFIPGSMVMNRKHMRAKTVCPRDNFGKQGVLSPQMMNRVFFFVV